MRLEWTYAALSLLDQLNDSDASNVRQAVERLPSQWDALQNQNRLKRLSGGLSGLFVLNAGRDLRVLVERQNDKIVVRDVVRQHQIESLSQAYGKHAAG